VLGVPDEGTRVYRKDGPEEETGPWFDALTDVVGSSVSPGGVSMYCPVSRAAVHKRMKEGRLTAFMFHATHKKTDWFGKKRVLRERPLCFIPVSECKAWKIELEDEAKRRKYVSQEALEGKEPDWQGDFMEWKNKSERYQESILQDFRGLTLKQKLGLAKALITGSSFEIVNSKPTEEGEK